MTVVTVWKVGEENCDYWPVCKHPAVTQRRDYPPPASSVAIWLPRVALWSTEVAARSPSAWSGSGSSCVTAGGPAPRGETRSDTRRWPPGRGTPVGEKKTIVRWCENMTYHYWNINKYWFDWNKPELWRTEFHWNATHCTPGNQERWILGVYEILHWILMMLHLFTLNKKKTLILHWNHQNIWYRCWLLYQAYRVSQILNQGT